MTKEQIVAKKTTNPLNYEFIIQRLKLHLIPKDETLWTEARFEDFIEKRADIIFTKLAKYIS